MTASVKEIIKEVIHLFFPLLRLRRANKIIDEKIKRLEDGGTNLTYMLGYDKLSLDTADKYLSKTFDARKSLEDKAKSNVFGVTIAVSLIVGFSQIFTNTNFHSGGISFKIITMLLVLYSLVSVTIGTILSLLVLGKYNRVYDLVPEDENNVDENKKLFSIAINAELNSLYNVKRNNILYSSYGLIINFLVAISVSFLIVIINTKQQDVRQDISKLQIDNQKIENNLQKALTELERSRDENNKLLEKLNIMEKKVISKKRY